MTAPRRDATPPAVLGTPLTDAATKVLLLGSGELGKEVAIAFQRLGVEVIAVDRYADAPAQHVAHHSAVIDMTDPDQVIDVVEKFQPDFVVPEIEAIATDALVEVERRGLAEVIPTAHAVVTTMNREGIRRLADEQLGLPVSPYLFVDSLDELTEAAGEIGFPCVVKPVMSSSGKGQSIVRSADEVPAAWETATTGARVASTRLIVEGYIEFDYEITLLTVRAIDPATGRLSTHFCAPIGHFQVNGDYVESWQPHEMNSFALGSATSIAARIATALGDGKLGGRGIFGVELFVKGDDVYFSEVSPRPHDTGLVTLATQRLSEFEMHARAILGLPVDVTLASPGASAVIYGQLDEKGIGFTNVAAALAIPETDIRLFGKPESFHRRRMGVVTATADDVATARKRAVAAASLVNPVSTADGKDAAEATAVATVVAPPSPTAKQSLVKPPAGQEAPSPDEPTEPYPVMQATQAHPSPSHQPRPTGPTPAGPAPAGPAPVNPQGAGPNPQGPPPGAPRPVAPGVGQPPSVQPSRQRPPQGPNAGPNAGPPNSPLPNGRTPMVQPHRPGPPAGAAGRGPNGAAQAGPGPSGPRRPVPPSAGSR